MATGDVVATFELEVAGAGGTVVIDGPLTGTLDEDRLVGLLAPEAPLVGRLGDESVLVGTLGEDQLAGTITDDPLDGSLDC